MCNRKAFSMLELIFVIVVVGILSKFGVEFLAQAYRNFIFSNINNRLQAQSEAAVEFIAKRLEHRIKSSAITRQGLGGVVTSIKDASVSGNTWTVLEWIAEDVDGFRGTTTANWSGILDLDDAGTTQTTLRSPGTNFADTATSITNLGGLGIADAAIHFVRGNQDFLGFGWNGLPNNVSDRSIHPVGTNANGFTPTGNSAGVGATFQGAEVFEFYKLAWTAYGIFLDQNDDLWLYYNYQPWRNQSINNGVVRQLIMQNVSSFQFRPVDELLKIQVCVHSGGLISGDANDDTATVTGGYAICKEKTVF